MFDRLAAPIFGGMLVLGALAAMYAHARAWRKQQADPIDDEMDRAHYRSRYRRRMQTTGVIALLGVMIAVGDALVPWQRINPIYFMIYWLMAMFIACWVLLLALGDMLATRAHSQASLARLRARQRVLEGQLDEMRRDGPSRSSNGRGGPE